MNTNYQSTNSSSNLVCKDYNHSFCHPLRYMRKQPNRRPVKSFNTFQIEVAKQGKQDLVLPSFKCYNG